MLLLDRVLGSEDDPALADRLHALEHRGAVEYVWLQGADLQRRRIRARSSAGTECAIALGREDSLASGAVLLLDEHRAVVIRSTDLPRLEVTPCDAAAALELGYLAGNMHWKVEFDGPRLSILVAGERADYLSRLMPLVDQGRARLMEAGDGR